jgi:two-component system response regulator AlgR
MTLNVLIVDDEPPARARMRQVLADCGRHVALTVAGEAESGPRAIAAVDELKPDVVLLDIHMPGMDGIEAARHIAQRERPPAIIFVTAFEEHALQAFEVQALDYLMKPVRAERLVAALARTQRVAKQEPRLTEVARSLGTARTHLTVSERGRMILVAIDDVLYLRAELKYVTIRTLTREHLTEESLTTLESEFGDRFVRIHRNALVARKSILGFQRVKAEASADGEAGEGHWEVLLKEFPERLPISRRQWAMVKATARV